MSGSADRRKGNCVKKRLSDGTFKEYTDHVALGANTHKVINMQHITRDEERSTQKHETVGCELMYNEFDKRGIKVNLHIHDRNMSVNKAIKSKEYVTNCNERWHATKSVTSGVKAISNGSKNTRKSALRGTYTPGWCPFLSINIF